METHHVRSMEQVRQIVEDTPINVDLEFLLREDTPLADAAKFWGSCNYGGGHGTLGNPDVLFGKGEALEFVQSKMARLRRWAAHANRKLNKVLDSTDHMEAVLAEGGPGLPAGYKPKEFHTGQIYLDVNLDVNAEDLDEHITSLCALMLEDAPGTPADEDAEQKLQERDAQDQRAMAEFLKDYMQLKRDVMATMKYGILDGSKPWKQSILDHQRYWDAGPQLQTLFPLMTFLCFQGKRGDVC